MSSEFVNIETSVANSQSSEWVIDQTIHCARFRIEKAARLGKFFILKSAADPADLIAVSLLHKEFELTYRLDHPSIRRALSIEHIDSVGDVLVLEYIDGRDIDARDVAELPKVARRKILTDLLDAVSYLHARQTIHRDIKPQNILVTYNGSNVKLIDLGFSDADDHSELKSPAGTLDYMAPEQRLGKALDVRADIYSLGVIFERCFSDVVHRRIYRRCINDDPAKRYGSVIELIAAIKSSAEWTKLWRSLALILIIIGMIVGVWYFSIEAPVEVPFKVPALTPIEVPVQAPVESKPTSGQRADTESNSDKYERILAHCIQKSNEMCNQTRSKRDSMDKREYYDLVNTVYVQFVFTDLKSEINKQVAEAFDGDVALQQRYGNDVFIQCRDICVDILREASIALSEP